MICETDNQQCWSEYIDKAGSCHQRSKRKEEDRAGNVGGLSKAQSQARLRRGRGPSSGDRVFHSSIPRNKCYCTPRGFAFPFHIFAHSNISWKHHQPYDTSQFQEEPLCMPCSHVGDLFVILPACPALLWRNTSGNRSYIIFYFRFDFFMSCNGEHQNR